jgi:hypothetical protein
VPKNDALLFEEAAGNRLYRDRKHSTERRLEETATDLQRLEDLIAEVQSQNPLPGRQKGKAERHAKLMEEKFAVTLTLARRPSTDPRGARLPGSKTAIACFPSGCRPSGAGLTEATTRQDEAGRGRLRAEEHRTEIARQLADVQVARPGWMATSPWPASGSATPSSAAPGTRKERAHASRRTEEAARRAGIRRPPSSAPPSRNSTASSCT